MKPTVLFVALFAAAAATPKLAFAQVVCDQPRPRDTGPLLKAIQDDDSMASTFDVTSGACAVESAACDAQKLKCGDQLTQMLQRQVNVDNGMWLRDMLLPFLGQRYTPTANISTTEVAQDVSCNADAPSLKAAATRRRQLAQRRRDIVNEYPKWAMWAAGIAQKCKSDQAAVAKQSAEAAVVAKAQADAALAAKQAEELRQDNAKKAELAALAKVEADKKAKEDAAKAQLEQQKKQQEMQAELMKRQQEQIAEQQRREREARMTEQERLAEQKRREEEEKKRKAEEAERARVEAEERKKEAAQAAADEKFVADREAKKLAAEKKAEELRTQENARREAHEKQLAEVEGIDRSDERLKGSMGAQAQAGYMSVNSANGGFMMGLLLQIRYGLWMTAPAHGYASGMELKINGSFYGLVAGQGGAQYFSAAPELRWFISRFAIGATFEWRRLVTPLPTTDPLDTYALGINLGIAMVDTPDGRAIFGVKWLPAFFGRGVEFAPERISAELELGYKWFMATIQGGTVNVRNGASNTIGFFAGAGVGARLRF